MTNETAENLRRAYQRVATERAQKRAQERAQQRAQAPVTVSPPDQVLLGYADLRALGISYSREHLRRLMAAGKFPLAVTLGPEKHARKMWVAES